MLALVALPAVAAGVASPPLAAGSTIDTNFVVGQTSSILNYGGGTDVAYVELHNPSTYLSLKVSRTFSAEEFDAAGTQIGTITAAGIVSGFAAVPPGEDGLVELQTTVPGVTSISVANPAGFNSDDLADRLPVVGAPTVTRSSVGSYLISGLVSNPALVAQSGRITVEVFGATGRLIDGTYGYTDSSSIPGGASGTFSVAYNAIASSPAPASFQYYVDGTPVSASGSQFLGYIPVSTAPVAGKPIYVQPKLVGVGTLTGLPGKTVQVFARTPGSAPRLLATGVTRSDGTAPIKVTIPPAVVISFVFAGDATRYGSSTGDLYYMVTPALGLSGPRTAVRPGSTQVLTGSFRYFPGETAVLQRLVGKHWQQVNNGGAGGRFLLHVTAPHRSGRYAYRLLVAGNPSHGAATSKTFTLTVR